MNIILISDNFYPNIVGGAEIVDYNLCQDLNIKDKILSSSTKPLIYEKAIVSNFFSISKSTLQHLIYNPKSYIILEHDYKFMPTRNPFNYPGYMCPKESQLFLDLYNNADCILLQSDDQLDTFSLNGINNNLISLKCSYWNKNELDLLKELEQKTPIHNEFAIINSNNYIKNTEGAIKWCISNNIKYKLINQNNSYKEFLEELSKYIGLVFFPLAKESLCRLVLEAKCMGLHVITTSNYGASKADYFNLNRRDLISYLENKSIENLSLIANKLTI